VRHYAGCAALCGILSLRGVEILRYTSMSSPEFVLGDVSSMLWLRCMAGKESSRQKAQPFDAFAPTVGFLGDASDWMNEMYDFVMGTTGLNCMVPDFTSPSGDSVAVSDGWLLSQPMSPERWALVVAQLLALGPYGASKESLIASGFNIHAFHGLLSCIIRSFLSETTARRFSEVRGQPLVDGSEASAQARVHAFALLRRVDRGRGRVLLAAPNPPHRAQLHR